MRLESPLEDAVLFDAVSLLVRLKVFLEPPIRLEAFLVPAVVHICDSEFEGDFGCLPSLERSVGDFLEVPSLDRVEVAFPRLTSLDSIEGALLEVPSVEIFEGDIP